MTIDDLQAAWAVMHKDNMDVYYDLISVYDNGDCIKIACDVVNLGYTGNPWVVQHNLVADMPYKEVANFKEVSFEQVKRPRTKPWVPA